MLIEVTAFYRIVLGMPRKLSAKLNTPSLCLGSGLGCDYTSLHLCCLFSASPHFCGLIYLVCFILYAPSNPSGSRQGINHIR